MVRRTSTLMTSSSGDAKVKFDDVEHLGNYIQVCGLGGSSLETASTGGGMVSYCCRHAACAACKSRTDS